MRRIPNEDGYAAEFDASGLFDLQRFYGYDLVEDGPRLNVGMRYFYQKIILEVLKHNWDKVFV